MNHIQQPAGDNPGGTIEGGIPVGKAGHRTVGCPVFPFRRRARGHVPLEYAGAGMGSAGRRTVVLIRASRASDMDGIVGIWLDANLRAHSFIPAEYWKDNLGYVREAIALAEVHVYEDERGVQGFIGLDGGHVEDLFVATGMRSRGIGRRLLDHAKRGRDRLVLEAYRRNTRAVSFYQREGFEIQGEGPDARTGEMEYSMIWRRDRRTDAGHEDPLRHVLPGDVAAAATGHRRGQSSTAARSHSSVGR